MPYRFMTYNYIEVTAIITLKFCTLFNLFIIFSSNISSFVLIQIANFRMSVMERNLNQRSHCDVLMMQSSLHNYHWMIQIPYVVVVFHRLQLFVSTRMPKLRAINNKVSIYHFLHCFFIN